MKGTQKEVRGVKPKCFLVSIADRLVLNRHWMMIVEPVLILTLSISSLWDSESV